MKIFKKIVLPILISVLIEVLVFNFAPLLSMIKNEEPVEFTADELTFVNWEESNNGRLSQTDASIFIENISVNADTLTVHMTAHPQPGSYKLFLAKGGEYFSAENMLVTSNMTGDDSFQLERNISAVCVNLGENVGVELEDISFVFSNSSVEVSLSRIVAMLVIWWGTKFLMSMQKAPDYGMEQKTEG